MIYIKYILKNNIVLSLIISDPSPKKLDYNLSYFYMSIVSNLTIYNTDSPWSPELSSKVFSSKNDKP